MDTERLLRNFERMLDRFSKEELEESFNSFESSKVYTGPAFSDIESWSNAYNTNPMCFENKDWFAVDSSYFTRKCKEIGSVFVDYEACIYEPDNPKEINNHNKENPQNEFAGFLLV